MYCRHCGQQNSEANRYCIRCGRELSGNGRKKWLRVILAIAAAVAVCAAVWTGIAAFGSRDPAPEDDGHEVVSTQAPTSVSADQWKGNILMSSEVDVSVPLGGYKSAVTLGPVYGADLYRNQIRKVVFEDTLANAPQDSLDASLAQDRSVLVWFLPEANDMYEMHIAAEGGINGKIACKDLFCGYSLLEEVVFNDCFHTEQAEDFSRMFYGCSYALEDLDLRQLRTDSAVNLSEMFACCQNLTSLDISSFDTSNVRDMSGMFSNCWGLQTVDMSALETANVTDVSYMFYRCPAVVGWDFANVDFGKVEKYAAFVEDDVQIAGRPWKTLFDKTVASNNEQSEEKCLQTDWDSGSMQLTFLSKDHLRIELEDTLFMEEEFFSGDERLSLLLYHSEDDLNLYETVVYCKGGALQCHSSYLFAGSAANDYHPEDLTWSYVDGKVTMDLYTGDLVRWNVYEFEKIHVYCYNTVNQKSEDLSVFWPEY